MSREVRSVFLGRKDRMVGPDLVPIEYVESRILEIRGRRVILDSDLAALYGVETRTLNQAVRPNEERFPDDFRFQLTEEEKEKVITDCDHLANLRFSPHLPTAFTEHGALMCSGLPFGQLGRSLGLLLREGIDQESGASVCSSCAHS